MFNKKKENCLIKNLITRALKRMNIFKIIITLALITMVQTVYMSCLKKEYREMNFRKNDLFERNEKLVSNLEELKIKRTIALLIGKRTKNLTSEQAARIANIIFEESNKYQMDPLLVTSVICTESSFDLNAKSNKGAIGLMQLKPSTAEYIADMIDYDFDLRQNELTDYQHNIVLGINYLKHLIDKFGTVEKGLIAYNIGEWKLHQKIKNGEKIPQRYYNKINEHYKKFKLGYNQLLTQINTVS